MQERSLSPALAHLVGWALFAVVQIAVLLVRGDVPHGLWLAAQYLGQLAAQNFVLGALGAGVLLGFERSRLPAAVGWVALVVVALALSVWGTQTELGNLQLPMRTAVGVVVGLAIPLAVLAGVLARRKPWMRVAVIVIASLGVAGVYAVRPGEYPVAHGFGLWALVCFEAAALVEFSLPAREGARKLGKWAPRLGVAGLVLAVAGVLAPIGATVNMFHARHPGSVLFIQAESSRGELEPVDLAAMGLDPEWFVPRSGAKLRPAPSPLIEDPIILMLTVDALRSELVTPEYHERFPELARHWRAGTHYERAYSPASSTVPAFGSIMTGKYFSALHWEKEKLVRKEKYFLAKDKTLRFPEVLSAAGVRTVNIPMTNGLLGKYGVVAGFSEESEMRRNARREVDEVLLRIDNHSGGPLFIATHMPEPHAPYRGRIKKGKPFARYLSEVDIIEGEFGRLREGLETRGVADRTIWIITADHGEAFGEHGSKGHASTIYEELVHVPLIIEIPGQAGHGESEPVTLLDLGPTIMDLFGVPTPGHWMGESLLPRILDPEAPPPTRPVAINAGRLMQALIFPDGHKAILDLHRETEEVYDLLADPEELENLAGLDPYASLRLDAVALFFSVHEHTAPDYETPYRP